MANVTIDTWKVTAIGLVLLIAAVGITTFVVGQKNESESPKVTPKKASVERHRAVQAEINKCNEYAASQVSDKTTEVLKDAGIGGVAGAGTGAAGGAIAGGGSGAGKGGRSAALWASWGGPCTV